AHQGKLGQYLELAKAFEQADWELQQRLSQQWFGKPIDLSPHYLQAVEWAHGLLLTASSQ
ncbi:MAG: histidine kinase, partial [Gammaproteobacteria bacterium]|nr:histidine kinase [Gammaproteobacteria bacterium]